MPKGRDSQDGDFAQVEVNQGGIESRVRFIKSGEEGEEFRRFVCGEVPSVVFESKR